jgi:membrane-associated phospholipid phosphatase
VFLDGYADLRGDRTSEILSQMGGAGAFLSSISFLHPDRSRWTLELLAAALRMANSVEMRLKHAFACRRPVEYSPQVQPMILTPSHGTFPSGHATEAFVVAIVLASLLRYSSGSVYGSSSWRTQLVRLAARVAINRTIAGLHFPIDSAAGAVLGMTLGRYFVQRCRRKTTYNAWGFDSSLFPDPTAGKPPPDDGDFYWSELFDVVADNQLATPYSILRSSETIAATPVQSPLRWLWQKARSEWD